MEQMTRNNSLSNIVLRKYTNSSSEISRTDNKDIFTEYFKRGKKKSYLLDEQHIFNIYMLEKQEGRKACIYVTILTHFAMKNAHIDSINYLIESLDESAVTSWSLMALLRTTYSSRLRINKWDRLYKVTYDHVLEEGLDPVRELHGLK